MKIEQILPLIQYNVAMEEPVLAYHDELLSRMGLYNDFDESLGMVLIDGKGKVYLSVIALLGEDGLRDEHHAGVFVDSTFKLDMEEEIKTNNLNDIVLIPKQNAQEISEETMLALLPKLYEAELYDDEEFENGFHISMDDTLFTELAKYAHKHAITLDEAMEDAVHLGFEVMEIEHEYSGLYQNAPNEDGNNEEPHQNKQDIVASDTKEQ
jgi:hypothetical protein